MKNYEVLNIDDEVIGIVSSAAAVTDYFGRLEIWNQIANWPYFNGFRAAVVGNFVHRYENSGTLGERMDIRFEPPDASLSFVVASVRLQRAKADPGGVCARCALPGKFIRTALICPNCKSLIGGF